MALQLSLRCLAVGHKTAKKGRGWSAQWVVYLMPVLSLALGVSSQLTSEAPPTEEDSVEQQIHQLIIDTPCLPCYREEGVGCKKVFGCIVHTDNSISSIFFSSSSLVGEPEKRSEKARIPSVLKSSSCLPCHYRDWYNRCRKIRGCIPDSDAPDITTFPPNSETEVSQALEEGFRGEESVSPEDTSFGLHAASGDNGSTGPSNSYGDSTSASLASASSVPHIEVGPTTTDSSASFVLFDVPVLRAAAPRTPRAEQTPPSDTATTASTTSSTDAPETPYNTTLLSSDIPAGL